MKPYTINKHQCPTFSRYSSMKLYISSQRITYKRVQNSLQVLKKSSWIRKTPSVWFHLILMRYGIIRLFHWSQFNLMDMFVVTLFVTKHSFQTRPGPSDPTRWTRNRCEIRFFSIENRASYEMHLPGLEPRHGQICNWSLATQPSMQAYAQ